MKNTSKVCTGTRTAESRSSSAIRAESGTTAAATAAAAADNDEQSMEQRAKAAVRRSLGHEERRSQHTALGYTARAQPRRQDALGRRACVVRVVAACQRERVNRCETVLRAVWIERTCSIFPPRAVR